MKIPNRFQGGKSLNQDEAIKIAISELKDTGKEYGLSFSILDDHTAISENTILVGDQRRNELTAALIKKGIFKPSVVNDEQGYEIISKNWKNKRIVLVAGGSLIGDVYGLYWILDRILINKSLPEINVRRIPELKIRSAIINLTKDNMRKALRTGINWIGGGRLNDLVPWGVEPEETGNRRNREKFKELIKYAHSLHMKIFIYTDEFTYHPVILNEFGATLSPEDPSFWDAVQSKFRRTLKELPEIDGFILRTGEFTLAGASNYQAYDVMHGEEDNSNWSLAKRYRTFIQKVHEVVVGEFNKIYFHRTWVTNSYEQHSKWQVYKKIFTDDLPTKNLYLSPYINQHDRWFFTAYNPTFNQTSHKMIALMARMDYHANANVNIFPTFTGAYFQAALQSILSAPQSNLTGVQFGMPGGSISNTDAIMSYTTSRLAWNHNEDLETILNDYSSIHFGTAAAKQMTGIFQLSAAAYKYGIYIEPVTFGTFNTLLHLRLTTFPAQGFPELDHGKQHMLFLRDLFYKCKPWINETVLYLDHGLAIADSMLMKYALVKGIIDDKRKAEECENQLTLMRNLIKTNNLYVKGFIAYFMYEENPSPENKHQLEENFTDLKNAIIKFKNTPGFVYHLFGIDQLIKNIELILKDYPDAQNILKRAPSPEEIKNTIAEQQNKYREILKKHTQDAVKFLHWEGKVDGRDILEINGDQIKIRHLRWDPITQLDYSFFERLPNKTVTVVPDDLYSRALHPFVLEQPSAINDYTVRIYLFDEPGGDDWVKFDLYYIPESPADLGLDIQYH
jgi:hypothetical protein